MAHAETSLLQQLSSNSDPYHDPLARLNWDALNCDDFWLPESALSLYGLPEYSALSDAARRRLSQYEFIGFIQAGLWLEGIFIERLGKTLKNTGAIAEQAIYMHEIREEAGHSLMFLKLMEKCGLPLPSDHKQRPRFSDFLGRHAPADSALFWLAVVVGEEIPDKLNRHIRTARDQVNPLIREMCTLHIIDEARHIAHARSALEAGLSNSSRITKHMLAPIVRVLVRQFVDTFYLPRAEIYELAGLTPGNAWRERARRNPERNSFIRQSINPTLVLLKQHGFRTGLERVPSPD